MNQGSIIVVGVYHLYGRPLSLKTQFWHLMFIVTFVCSLEIFKWKSLHSALTLVRQYPLSSGNSSINFQKETINLLRLAFKRLLRKYLACDRDIA